MAIGRSEQGGSFVFRGYRHPDGSVETRNYVAVLPMVACAIDVAERTGYDRMVDIYTRGPFV